MTKINKIIVSLLASFAITTSAFAGELTVTGTAKATYGTLGGHATGDNGLGVANELTFGANGELDNGWTWNYAMEIDPGTGATTNSHNDDTQMSLTTPYGSVAVCISECSLGGALKWSANAYSVPTDTGYAEGKTEPTNISGYNNMQYHTPAGLLPYSVQFKAAYAPSGSVTMQSTNASSVARSATVSSMTQYSATAVPVDGAYVHVSYGEQDGGVASGLTDAQAYEAGTVAGTYAYGAFTVGAGRSWISPQIATGYTGATAVESYENTNYSVGYLFNDNLSLSVSREKSVPDTMTPGVVVYEQKTTGIQAAYTMGGMTVALARAKYDNPSYLNSDDVTEHILAVTMAF